MFFAQDEKEICRIECGDGKKKPKGDTVTLTDRRMYFTQYNIFRSAVSKTVDLRSVNAVESGERGQKRYLIIGLAFLALCCLLATYLNTYSKIAGIAAVAVGAAFMIVCIVLFFTLKFTYIAIHFRGGHIALVSPGLTDDELLQFGKDVFAAKDKLRTDGQIGGEKRGED